MDASLRRADDQHLVSVRSVGGRVEARRVETMMSDDVQTLVERAQAGDDAAFEELYEHFAPETFRYLLVHLNGERQTAEDLNEDVFLKVFERLQSYRYYGAPFSAWLRRIARNHLIDHLRLRTRHVINSLDDEREITEQRAESVMDRALDRQELTYALDHLTVEQQHVVVLRFLNDFTITGTAQIMGKSDDAVKKLQARALVQLRRTIERTRRSTDVRLAALGTTATRPALEPRWVVVPPLARCQRDGQLSAPSSR